jgi:hypothetical protein
VKVLPLLHAWLASTFYAWALREIAPTHPDVPDIIRRKRVLDDRLRGIL